MLEKNCQKRRRPLMADSVIARLMGIDELPHQQPLHKHQRVLSDGYICKSASVGLRQGSSIFIGQSRGTDNELLQGLKNACGVKVYDDKNHFVTDKYTSKNTRTVKMVISNQKPIVVSLSKSTSGASHEDRKAIVRNIEHGAPGCVLRYVQKPIVVFSNNCDLTYKERFDNDIGPPRRSFIDRIRTTNRTSRQQKCRSNLQDLSRPANEGKNYTRNEFQASLPSCSGAFLGQETLQKDNERRKIGKEIEKIEVSGRSQTHQVKMEAFAKMEPTPLNLRLGRNGLCTQSCKQSRNSGYSSPWEKDHNGNLFDSESETTKESLFVRSGGKMDEEQEILKNRCGGGRSPVMNSSMLQSATRVEISTHLEKAQRIVLLMHVPKQFRMRWKITVIIIGAEKLNVVLVFQGHQIYVFQYRINDALADVEAFNGEGSFLKSVGTSSQNQILVSFQ